MAVHWQAVDPDHSDWHSAERLSRGAAARVGHGCRVRVALAWAQSASPASQLASGRGLSRLSDEPADHWQDHGANHVTVTVTQVIRISVTDYCHGHAMLVSDGV